VKVGLFLSTASKCEGGAVSFHSFWQALLSSTSACRRVAARGRGWLHPCRAACLLCRVIGAVVVAE